MTINAAAAVATGQVQTQIQTAILSKIMQQVKSQQEGVVDLIDAALESARQIGSTEPGKGATVDVHG